MNKGIRLACLAIAVIYGASHNQARAAALGFTGTDGFIVDGNILNLQGGVCFPVACTTGLVPFNVSETI